MHTEDKMKALDEASTSIDDWKKDFKLRRKKFEEKMAETDAQDSARKAEYAEKAKELAAQTKFSVVKLSLQIFAGFIGIAAITIGHFGWLWGIVFTLSTVFLIHGSINLTGLILARGLLFLSHPGVEEKEDD